MTPAAVRAALEVLGSTQGAVADALLARGFTGTPGNSRDCPVARYLNHTFPGTEFQVTGLEIFDQRTIAERNSVTVVTVDTPWPIERFIAAFDTGDVPELVSSYD